MWNVKRTIIRVSIHISYFSIFTIAYGLLDIRKIIKMWCLWIAPFCRRWETQTLAAGCGPHLMQLLGPGHKTISLSSILSRENWLHLVNKLSWQKKYRLKALGWRWDEAAPLVLVSVAWSLSCIFWLCLTIDPVTNRHLAWSFFYLQLLGKRWTKESVWTSSFSCCELLPK